MRGIEVFIVFTMASLNLAVVPGRTVKRIQDEIEDLTSAKNAGYTEYRESQKREKELQTVKANIEKMLRLQEPEIGQERKRDEQEL